jgi:hypothetical protein
MLSSTRGGSRIVFLDPPQIGMLRLSSRVLLLSDSLLRFSNVLDSCSPLSFTLFLSDFCLVD